MLVVAEEQEARTFGKGRVVYYPFNIDQVFWEEAVRDHLVLISNAIDWAGANSRPMHLDGAGLIDVSYWQQARSVAAHLVNLNSPAAMRGFIHEQVPLGPLVVSLELPAGTRAARVRLLESGKTAEVQHRNGKLVVRVPQLQLHEVIAIDLA